MRTLSGWLFLFVNIVSVLTVFAASDENLIPALSDSVFEVFFVNSLSGNSILFNLSMGIIVSSLFYFIVVYLPEKQKKNDILPQIDQHVSEIIAKTWILVSETVNHSGKGFEIERLKEDEFLEACKAVNPCNLFHKFHNGGAGIYQLHFGYVCSNNWDHVLRNINEVMHFLPYVDTGVVKILNKIRSASLGQTIGMLKDIDKLNNTDMSSWSSCIFNVYKLSIELEIYYVKYINKKFGHPYKKT
ncbi:hypothetical protein QWY20_03760 [Alkalimonas sp. MEB108]|uniref:Uncharacterized protein n=1 Tax=Alkalimonas cellulosilytica TaxID=3058395 RepID=A0ABU7J2G5_9GAMM|nr:hypothetical protein [Alkalimonas sp. MEB108]MEE2000557.1 hypothetical protein [Alkalimonas sp. MEB108]